MAYKSKKGPVTNEVHVSPSPSFLFKYATVSNFLCKNEGRIALAFSFLTSLPKAEGTKRFTPALIAMSMNRS